MIQSIQAGVTEHGFQALSKAGIVATDILKSISKTDITDEEAQSLPLFKHLTSSISKFIIDEGLFHLPSGLGKSSLRTTSAIWMQEAAIAKPHMNLLHFDEIIGDIAQMFRWFSNAICT